MNLRCYASIQEITGKDLHDINPTPKSVSELQDWLMITWPILREVTFVISVNRKVVNDPYHPLSENDEVALLPPFSGG
jgi:molybdopterin converting factor small subunit